MQFHHLKRNTPYAATKRVGRGGKRGKTSGRGTKGQSARAGNKKRPELRDIIKKIPKLRGYNFASIQERAFPVNVDTIEKLFGNGEAVTPSSIVKKGITGMTKGRLPRIKILSRGVLTKRVIVSDCLVSGSAREKIEKAGGSFKA
jgi:large subunit ribosomal protein L15